MTQTQHHESLRLSAEDLVKRKVMKQNIAYLQEQLVPFDDAVTHYLEPYIMDALRLNYAKGERYIDPAGLQQVVTAIDNEYILLEDAVRAIESMVKDKTVVEMRHRQQVAGYSIPRTWRLVDSGIRSS